jgi:hypothetical protein
MWFLVQCQLSGAEARRLWWRDSYGTHDINPKLVLGTVTGTGTHCLMVGFLSRSVLPMYQVSSPWSDFNIGRERRLYFPTHSYSPTEWTPSNNITLDTRKIKLPWQLHHYHIRHKQSTTLPWQLCHYHTRHKKNTTLPWPLTVIGDVEDWTPTAKLLLALISTVILGSESYGTHDHIFYSLTALGAFRTAQAGAEDAAHTSHTRLTLSTLPLKWNRLLLSRSRWLLNVEQQLNPSDR